MIWRMNKRLRGYRTVDHGNEVSIEMAMQLAGDTARRYARGRSAGVQVIGTRWRVMVKGWSPRKEDG